MIFCLPSPPLIVSCPVQENFRLASDDLQDWLTLHFTPGLGPAGLKQLIDYFGGPGQILDAEYGDIVTVPGVRKAAATKICSGQALEKAKKELERTEKANISIVTLNDPAYPAILRNIHDPPFLLYVKGDPKALDCAGIGVVGARAATEYGKHVSKNLAARLARKGLTVISGLALGIDTAAHKGALAAGGKTVGILGCGIDVVYPRQNIRLFREVSESGAIATEYPMGTRPEGYHFPARNRIISGLSLGVAVVEAARKSGSLITAQLALDQGRDVFAVPGRVDSSKSEGAHRLLQDGAKLVLSVDDIIEELNPGLLGKYFKPAENGSDNKKNFQGLDAEANRIYSFLDVYPKSIDEIIRGTGLTAQKVSELLLTMELKGMVAALPGKQYRKVVDL